MWLAQCCDEWKPIVSRVLHEHPLHCSPFFPLSLLVQTVNRPSVMSPTRTLPPAAWRRHTASKTQKERPSQKLLPKLCKMILHSLLGAHFFLQYHLLHPATPWWATETVTKKKGHDDVARAFPNDLDIVTYRALPPPPEAAAPVTFTGFEDEMIFPFPVFHQHFGEALWWWKPAVSVRVLIRKAKISNKIER